eukprot:m.37509 g.37509  ORF g.37509 m.37509 type:complete len:224 (-) comp10105_c0_seq2:574-1245(-)
MLSKKGARPVHGLSVLLVAIALHQGCVQWASGNPVHRDLLSADLVEGSHCKYGYPTLNDRAIDCSEGKDGCPRDSECVDLGSSSMFCCKVLFTTSPPPSTDASAVPCANGGARFRDEDGWEISCRIGADAACPNKTTCVEGYCCTFPREQPTQDQDVVYGGLDDDMDDDTTTKRPRGQFSLIGTLLLVGAVLVLAVAVLIALRKPKQPKQAVKLDLLSNTDNE